MDCGTAHDLLVPWMDGELAPSRSSDVEQHVDGCVRCGRALELLGRQDRALKVLRPELAEAQNDAFWERMDSALAPSLDRLGAPEAPAAPVPFWGREYRVSPVGLIAYAAALLLALGWSWMQLSATRSAEAKLRVADAELQHTRRLLAETAPPRLQAPLESAPRARSVVQVSHRGQL